MRHPLFAVLAVVSIAGCTSAVPTPEAERFVSLDEWAFLDADAGRVRLPPSPVFEVLGNRAKWEDQDTYLQILTLSNDTLTRGENRIEVRIREVSRSLYPLLGPGDGPRGRTVLSTAEQARTHVLNDLLSARFISEPDIRANGHGNYVFVRAVASDNSTCVFGWQTFAQPAIRRPNTVYSAAVDLRICDRERPAEALLRLIDELEILD